MIKIKRESKGRGRSSKNKEKILRHLLRAFFTLRLQLTHPFAPPLITIPFSSQLLFFTIIYEICIVNTSSFSLNYFGNLFLGGMGKKSSSSSTSSTSSVWRYLQPRYYIKRPKRLALVLMICVSITWLFYDRKSLNTGHQVISLYIYSNVLWN